MRRSLSILVLPLMLLACGEATDTAPTDDAGGQTQGTNAGGTAAVDTSPAAIEAAKARAIELVGGADALKPAPQPQQLAADAPDSPAMQAAARTLVAPGGESCVQKAAYSAGWTAKLPAEFPVYPRATTVEAAGTDDGACALRAVTFHTPVAIADVLAFYATRASAAGYGAEHVVREGEHVMSGARGNAAYVVYARQLAGGITEIDLVTSVG